MNWSFIICTDGITNIKYHNEIINSILKQNIPEFEIIFITENSNYTQNNSSVVYITPSIPNHITLKKNIGAKIAKFDNLCIFHDYITLGDNFYSSFEEFGYNWNVCSTKFLNINGERWWDYPVANHPEYNHKNMDYDFPISEYNYIPGMCFCIKKQFLLENPFNERLGWNHGEDIEWSSRINKSLNYKTNFNTALYSLKQKY